MARGGTLFSLEWPRGGDRCVAGTRPTGSAHQGVVGVRTHLSVALKFTQPNTKQLKVYNPTAPIAFIRCNQHPYLVPEHVITPNTALFPLSSHATPSPLAPSQDTDLCSVPMDLPILGLFYTCDHKPRSLWLASFAGHIFQHHPRCSRGQSFVIYIFMAR